MESRIADLGGCRSIIVESAVSNVGGYRSIRSECRVADSVVAYAVVAHDGVSDLGATLCKRVGRDGECGDCDEVFHGVTPSKTGNKKGMACFAGMQGYESTRF